MVCVWNQALAIYKKRVATCIRSVRDAINLPAVTNYLHTEHDGHCTQVLTALLDSRDVSYHEYGPDHENDARFTSPLSADQP